LVAVIDWRAGDVALVPRRALRDHHSGSSEATAVDDGTARHHQAAEYAQGHEDDDQDHHREASQQVIFFRADDARPGLVAGWRRCAGGVGATEAGALIVKIATPTAFLLVQVGIQALGAVCGLLTGEERFCPSFVLSLACHSETNANNQENSEDGGCYL